MKGFVTCTWATVLLGIMAGSLLAADGLGDTRPGRMAERPGMIVDNLIKALDLTDEQQKQVTQIFQTHKQDVENWQKEHGQELKDIEAKQAAARKAGDQEQVKALRDESAELVASRNALFDNLLKQLGDALTNQQMEKARDMLQPRRPDLMAALGLLNLDARQRDSIKEITDTARAEAEKAVELKDRAKIWRDAFDKIRTTVLTDEQRQILERIKRDPQMIGLAKLNLTDDQKKQIQEIVEKARRDAQSAKPDARRDIMRAAWKKIIDEVLTPDQRKQYEEWRSKAGAGLRDRFRDRAKDRRREKDTTSATGST
ncbi:MAG: hypothetical protein ACE15C_17765 [Phycisphaerae bacterium]